MTIREPLCLGRGGGKSPGFRPDRHSDAPLGRRASNEHGRPALGSNGLVGLVGPSALCIRGLPRQARSHGLPDVVPTVPGMSR